MIIIVVTSPYHFHHYYHHQNLHRHSFDHFSFLSSLFLFWYVHFDICFTCCIYLSIIWLPFTIQNFQKSTYASTWNMFNFMHDFKPPHVKMFVMYLGKYKKHLSYVLSLFCIQYSHPSVHFLILVPETSILIFIIWSHFMDSQGNKHCHNCRR
jgi:hypothetical protein